MELKRNHTIKDWWYTCDENWNFHTLGFYPSSVEDDIFVWDCHGNRHRQNGPDCIEEGKSRTWCLNDKDLCGRFLLWN